MNDKNIYGYSANSAKKKKKKQYLGLWDWITLILLLLGIISISSLTYHYWTKKQELKQLEAQLEQGRKETQQQYELQQKHLISLNSLANNQKVHSFFTDLLKKYSEKFAEKKEIDISNLPLHFKTLYSDPQTGNGYGAMGRCFPETVIFPTRQKQINLELNQLYLLNKFGHDKYFTGYPQGEYFYLDISFAKMLKTCSHELAHYFQLVKHEKTSCESDLILKDRKYDEELAKEQEEWTGEIYGMIKTEISELEKKWKEI